MSRKARKWILRMRSILARALGLVPKRLEARELELYCGWVLRLPEEGRRERVVGDRASHPDVARALVKRSYERRYSHPGESWRLARAAVDVAESLSLAPQTATLQADVRAEAWGNLANSLRVARRPEEAQAAWASAHVAQHEGSGDVLLAAQLARLEGAFRRDLRAFPEALQLLELSAAIFEAVGEGHLAAKTRVVLASTLDRAGQSETAIEVNERALEGLDHEREPQLAFTLLHNTLVALEGAGEEELALEGLMAAESNYRSAATPMIRLRYHWMRGRLHNSLGYWQASVNDLETARRGFLERDLGYDAAFVGIELALAYANLRRFAKVHSLAVELLPIFKHYRLPNEAAAVLLTFSDAVLAAQASAAEIEALARQLRAVRSAYERGEPWAEAAAAA